MTAYILFTGLLSFALALIAQIFLWRIWTPKKQMFWLFGIFLCLPLFVLIICTNWFELTLLDSFAAALLWLAIAVAYIQTYPALKEDIPSFRLLLLLENNTNRQGMSKDQIIAAMKQYNLFSAKLDELENDSLVVEKNGKFELSLVGRKLADFFYYYRKMLGLKRGEG
ncbi:membrane protein [Beggiatoa sp. PS]|nr:membrane protein [Beggiatoa sp. PS]